MRIRMMVVATVGLALTSAFAAAGQTTGRRSQPLVIESMVGQDLFAFYCASCHGRDATGHGPVASALRVPPADLTRLSQRGGGTFPRQRLTMFIANGGDTLKGAHGSNEMPVWGPIFVTLDPSDTRAMIRIENVVQYLESLQVK